jgi:Na+(H+)/acetate symporter ActP
MTVFLRTVFPEWVFIVISVVLVAAAMSTLDGLLVSISTITANDLVLNVFKGDERAPGERMRLALKVSHVVLVLIAVAAFLINLQPPPVAGHIRSGRRVRARAIAAAPPLLLGVLFERVSLTLVWAGSAAAVTVHFVLFFHGASLFPASSLTFANPGVTAAIAALATIPAMLVAARLPRRRLPPLANARESKSG